MEGLVIRLVMGCQEIKVDATFVERAKLTSKYGIFALSLSIFFCSFCGVTRSGKGSVRDERVVESEAEAKMK